MSHNQEPFIFVLIVQQNSVVQKFIWQKLQCFVVKKKQQVLWIHMITAVSDYTVILNIKMLNTLKKNVE